MFHIHITSILPPILQRIGRFVPLFVTIILISCANNSREYTGLFQGFIPRTEGEYQLFSLALYDDDSFVEAVQNAGAGSTAMQIESGSWIVHDDLLILSQDGIKDQRWRKAADGLILSGATQKADHWKLWKVR